MAREKMITRTIESTNVRIMGIDTASASVTYNVYFLNGTFKSDDEIIARVKADNGTAVMNGFIPVKVDFKEVVEKLYGMPESEFMKYAKELPPRKVYEQ